jgi:hypothetical protein
MIKQKSNLLSKITIGALIWFSLGTANGQNANTQVIPLNDLSAFKDPGNSWGIAGNVTADLEKKNVMKVTPGQGILVNNIIKKKEKDLKDLYTSLEHGDADIEFEYMMAKGSNSGLYLQARYEVQLLDSWGVKVPRAADNGGIYERWDDRKPEGQRGYEGFAPRQNVSKAPGVWQKMKISFSAPKFDGSGKKAQNAKIHFVELNGVVIHEDVELTGPTRGSVSEAETSSGPLRFQGDHGTVAFRNIQVTKFGMSRPEVSDLQFQVYKGSFNSGDDVKNLKPDFEGNTKIITTDVNPVKKQYYLRFTGRIKIYENGNYHFNLRTPGGNGVVKIDNKDVLIVDDWAAVSSADLKAGEYPFEVTYNKYIDWASPAFGLSVSGPGIREFFLSDESILIQSGSTDPILVNATENTILRCFIDLAPFSENDKQVRLSHSVNFGSPDNIHYTYDMNSGNLIQIWRGGFLDATPMWHSRGDGSARPLGTVKVVSRPEFSVARLATLNDKWQIDSTGTSYKPKGYTLDIQGQPTFKYHIHSASVSDAVKIINNGQGISREISIQNSPGSTYAKLAEGKSIEAIGNNLFLVDDKSYYLRIDNAGTEKPLIRNGENGRVELIIPLKDRVAYSILY